MDAHGWDAAYDAMQIDSPNYVTYGQYQNHLNGMPNGTPDVVDLSEQSDNEKDDVAIIDADELPNDVEMVDRPRADDCKPASTPRATYKQSLTCRAVEAMKKIVFLPLAEEPNILDETVFTWEIKNWRHLARREQGPIFEAGGHKW